MGRFAHTSKLSCNMWMPEAVSNPLNHNATWDANGSAAARLMASVSPCLCLDQRVVMVTALR